MGILCAVRAGTAARLAASRCRTRTGRCRNSFGPADRWLIVLSEQNSIACVGIAYENYTDHVSLTNTPEISEEDFLTALN